MKDDIQIMLIELNAQDAEFIANSLIQTQDFLWSISIAHCMEAGLELIESLKSAVLAILDIQTVIKQEKTAFARLVELKVPIIIIADLEHRELAEAYLAAGVQDYIIKENWCNRTINRSVIFSLYKLKEKQLAEYTADIELKNEELELVYNRINDELNKAFLLQQQFLPNSLSIIEGISMAVYFQPAERIGGDFYNVLHLDHQILFYIVDVSGHGLDGAMLNIFIREKINNYFSYQAETRETISPKALLNYINEQYRQENFPEEYMVCILAGALDLKTNTITFANAGIQIYPLLVYDNFGVNRLACSGPPITNAIDNILVEFNEVSAPFPYYSTLLITTDGIVEEVVNNVQYDVERLKRLLLNNHRFPPEIIAGNIKSDFITFAGKEQGEDDITIMIVQNAPIVDQLTLAIDSSVDEIDTAINNICDFLSPYYQDLDYLSIGMYEVIANAMEHGNKYISGKKVVISITVAKTYLKITVDDEGEGFDWRHIDSNLSKSSPYQERGRGILIAKLCFDFLQYYESGNKVCMISIKEPDSRGCLNC